MRKIALSQHEIHPPGPLFAWADSQRFKALPLGVRVLARRRNLSVWRALAVSEIASFGGLHDRS